MTTTHRKLIFFTWAGWIFDFFDLILYSFLLMAIQDEFLLSNGQVAIIYSCSLAVTAIGGVGIGYLGDRLGRKPAIMLSITIFSLGTLLSGIAWSLTSLLIFRIITGFGIGGEWASGHTLINESLPRGERGKASSIIQSGAPIGAALASVVGGFITPVIGWRLTFILASIPSFLLVVMMIQGLEESPQFAILKQEAYDLRENDEIPRGTAYVRQSTKRTWNAILSIKKNLFLGTILSLFAMLAYWIVFSWTPKYLVGLGYTNQQVGIWMIISQLGAFIGYLSFGFVGNRIGDFRKTFAGYAILFGLGIISFSIFTVLDMLSLGIVSIFLAGLGTGIFSGFGPLYANLFPLRVRNTSASCCFNFGRLGAFVAPILVASLADLVGFAIAISTGSIFAFLAAIWVFTIDSEKIEYSTSISSNTDLEVGAEIKVPIIESV